MQPKQNMPILGKNDNASENFGPHEYEKSTLEEKDFGKDYTNLVGKNSDTRSRLKDGLSRPIPKDDLLASESILSLKEFKFSEIEFSIGKPVLDIQYHHLGSQNNNLFHQFNNYLDYILAIYFLKFETRKSNIDRFLSDLLIPSLTKKLSY